MRYTNRLLGLIIAISVSSVAYPCGPFPWDAGEVWFFQVTDGTPTKSNNTKLQNLQLWQRQTSDSIPLTAIEEIVYGDFEAESWNEGQVPKKIRENMFYKWIRSTQATDIQEFLTLAKRVERCRAEKCSPWYYPAEKAEKADGGVDGGFTALIEQCSKYKKGRLRERYGLQMIRLLHASCQYEECVAAFNEYFDGVQDSHLMKRMAMSYVAGAWTRLGDRDKANRYFAMKGDVNSLHGVDPLMYMAEVNPTVFSMRELETLIRRTQIGLSTHGKGEEYVKDTVLNAAYKFIHAGKARNMGDWEFLVAYIEGEYNNDYTTANQYIRRALSHRFSTQRGRDHARAYKMAVDGSRGNIKPLLDDIKWLEDRVRIQKGEELDHWREIMFGIVYGHWFDYLVEHNHLSMAILLSNYTDNFCALPNNWSWFDGRLLTSQEKEQMRKSRTKRNEIDFHSTSVNLMMNLKPQDLIDYKNCLNDDSPLVTYLRDGGRNDDDYLNEIIGTLYMREGNYIGAYNWLSKVSSNYQYTLNTYKEGYLQRDPFAFTSTSRMNSKESRKGFPLLSNKWNIKLNFAADMYRLEQEMKNAKDDDTRALATIKYALARYASFSSCWALTCYGVLLFHEISPSTMPYRWEDIDSEEEKLMRSMVKTALASIKSRDAAAEAQYLLGNLKTVAKRYPDTPTGKFLSTHCDNWNDWI